MTREERLALLSHDTIAHIHELVEAAPEPHPEVIDKLRRILAPAAARALSRKTPAADAA